MQQENNTQQEPEENGKNTVDQSRRKALKKIAVGTAVAGALAVSSKWTKPVVNSVILPAHAQATNVEGPANTTTTTTTANVNYPEYSTEGDGAMIETITVTLSPDEVASGARSATLQKKRRKK